MAVEGIQAQTLFGAPPLMPWQAFADWIGMQDEPEVVRAWLERGYLPRVKIGKRVMVNVALLTRNLLEEEAAE